MVGGGKNMKEKGGRMRVVLGGKGIRGGKLGM
jgi:hypothetical protein